MTDVEQPPRFPYVHVDVPKHRVEEISTELWDLGAEGIEERDAQTMTPAATAPADATPAESLKGASTPDASASAPHHPVPLITLVAFFSEESKAREVATVFEDRFPARVEFVVGDAWRDSWKEYFKPSRVGSRFVIRPTWEEVDLQDNDVEIVIDPGRAFGSGIHETTRLVLGSLDSAVTDDAPVLDLGCGSGILAIAAVKLGASRAVCVDIEDDAIEVTMENAHANGVADRIEASTTAIEDLTGEYPLVLANIQAHVLIPRVEAIRALIQPGGLLVLSGILAVAQDDVIAAYSDLKLEGVDTEGEWVGIRLRAV